MVTFDPVKRAKTLTERGLDFADAALIFAGVTVEIDTLGRTTARGASSATACWRVGLSLWVIPRVARIVTSLA